MWLLAGFIAADFVDVVELQPTELHINAMINGHANYTRYCTLPLAVEKMDASEYLDMYVSMRVFLFELITSYTRQLSRNVL